MFEQTLHLFRSRVGGDIVVGRNEAEHFVAHTAAGPIGFVPGIPQALNDVDGELAVGHGNYRY